MSQDARAPSLVRLPVEASEAPLQQRARLRWGAQPIRWWSRWWILWLVLLLGVLQALRVRRAELEPLLQYGVSGAEYLELIQLEHARALVAGDEGVWRLARAPDYLRLLDGEYPAGLHLLSVYWEGWVSRGAAAELFPRALTLLWLVGLVVGVLGLIARLRPRSSAENEAGRAHGLTGLLLVTGILLSPAVLGSAHRYYYDLPMTALCTLALASLVGTQWKDGVLAGVFTGLALLVKWQSALYLAPAWGVGVGLGLVHVRAGGWRLLLSRLAGVLTTLVWVSPLVFVPQALNRFLAGQLPWSNETSLGMAIMQATGATPERGPGWMLSMWKAMVGPLGGLGWLLLLLGLWMSCGTGFSLLRKGHWRIHGAVWILLATCFLPLTWLLLRVRVADERFLLPIFPAILVAAVLGVCAGGRSQSVQSDPPGMSRFRRKERWWGLLLVGLWSVQALTFEGLLDLPPALHARASTAHRGWSPLGGAPKTFPRLYLEAAGERCSAKAPEMQVRIFSAPQSMDALHAWRWAVLKACTHAEILVNPDSGPAPSEGMTVDIESRRLIPVP